MKNMEPVNLKGVLIVYNFAMVGLSVYMFHEVNNAFLYTTPVQAVYLTIKVLL